MNNLSLIRNLYGVTQDEFAKLINLNRGSLSAWENGKKKMSELSIHKISNFLGISADYIYEKELTPEIKEKIINAGKRYRVCQKKDFYSFNLEESTIDVIIQNYLLYMDTEKLKALYQLIVHMKKLVEYILDKREEKREL